MSELTGKIINLMNNRYGQPKQVIIAKFRSHNAQI